MLEGLTDRELDTIANEMAQFAGRVRSLRYRAPSRTVKAFEVDEIRKHAPALAAAARREHELRRMRDAYIGTKHFGEPAWDIMLDMFANTLLGKQISTSSLCIAAHVPPTTALRHIKILVEEGFLIRCSDPNDARRILLQMTDEALASVGSYFMALGGYLDDDLPSPMKNVH